MIMRSHPFDPVSAVLALIALVAGILVVNGATVPLEGDVAPWFAVIALIFGLLLLPWTMFRRRSRPAPVDEAVDQDDDDESAVRVDDPAAADLTGQDAGTAIE